MASQEEPLTAIYRLAAAVVGNENLAQNCMQTPGIGLNRQIPAELIETTEGAELVETYLMQIEHGVCA